jgi:hypothetical protein
MPSQFTNAPHAPALVLSARLPLKPSGWDICCTPATLDTPPIPARRSKLAELDGNLHCSIIGTCLSTTELRRIIPRYAPLLDRKQASDLQIHHTAVEFSINGGAVAKELNKLLDERHALTIKKFRTASDQAALGQLWQEALAAGDIPGAYWALMTHPLVNVELRNQAFGDVHMLSHLVGAANRADIRRLVALEAECEQLKEQNTRQQSRLHDLSKAHAESSTAQQHQLADLKAQLVRQEAMPDVPQAELAQLRAALSETRQKLALQTDRHNEVEQRLLTEQTRNTLLNASAQRAQEEATAAQMELRALEQAFLHTMSGAADGNALPQLDGKCVLYVGGRPGVSSVLVKMVAAASGELLVHDGGLEDRKGMLAAMLPRADLVVFPVDFVSHNAMHLAKQTCLRHGIPCHPIRSASVASFVELMQRLFATAWSD